MKPESLEALGAKPLDPEIAARLGLADHFDLGEFRERLPELIGECARVIADNPLAFGFLLSADYVLAQAVINLVKPRGIFGAAACGIVSYAACTLIAAELFKRDLIKIKIRDGKDSHASDGG